MSVISSGALAPALKLGQRVRVLPHVSNRQDAESLRQSKFGQTEPGIPRTEYIGRVGEIVQIGQEVLPIKNGQGYPLNEQPATCPGDGLVLVDSQVIGGVRQGANQMREWYRADEIEVG